MRTDLDAFACSIARTLGIVDDAWGLLVLRDVLLGVTRFDDLAADLGISRKVLAARLDRLVVAGILERVPYAARPPRFDYLPTTKGRDLLPVLLALMAWGDRWAAPAGAPLRLRHTGCGELTTPELRCSCCGQQLDLADLVPEPGPGGSAGPGTRVLAARLAGGQPLTQGRRSSSSS